jgi:hypothetical protein
VKNKKALLCAGMGFIFFLTNLSIAAFVPETSGGETNIACRIIAADKTQNSINDEMLQSFPYDTTDSSRFSDTTESLDSTNLVIFADLKGDINDVNTIGTGGGDGYAANPSNKSTLTGDAGGLFGSSDVSGSTVGGTNNTGINTNTQNTEVPEPAGCAVLGFGAFFFLMLYRLNGG